uniref:Putative cuticular protein 56f n=1 Tax=Lutzomyia longipalpis TaxID=7200 RepID=A0A7G3AI14_LUTLO
MKIFAIVCTLSCLALVCAEPPVHGHNGHSSNGYPSSTALQTPNNNYLPPSTSYGVPSNTNNHYQPRPSSTYGAPSNGHGSNGHGSNGHGSNGHGSNGHYHTSQSSFQAPSQQYGAPSQQYGAPSQQYGAPSQQYGAPSQQYGAPAITGATFKPSSQYGAPSQGHSNGNGYQNGYSNGGSNGYGNGGYEYNEPAKYSFEYQVLDYPSGNDFGHMESRDGDRAVGRYYVLLPDGRKQIVTYEADEKGYRPTITYEDTGNGANGGGNYAASNGYNNNGQFHGDFRVLLFVKQAIF